MNNNFNKNINNNNNCVIITDSTSDLPEDIIKKFNIHVIPMQYIINNKNYLDININIKEFYENLRAGVLPSTTQINIEQFKEVFTKYLKNNQDIIYIGFPSSLSGTYNNSVIAARELSQEYPNNKIITIDSLSASLGQGILVCEAALRLSQGESLEEIESVINNLKSKICHWLIVDDLFHLKRGGRVSKTVAVLGGMLSFKPLLYVNNSGNLCLSEKIRGRQKAIDTLVSKLEQDSIDLSEQVVYICHADCIQDAQILEQKIREKFKVKNIIINYIGPIVGTHVGSGTLAVIFIGDSRQKN